ncbi:LysR family transcriptional regulator [Shimwellia pseudoproteus]|uniref:LysR family transcriptional regulator n=1 Tax=Shimwellia pseudoproteus TaxID=570012 RepID=UPI0018EA85AE|nr:LysR family transcriptional regulator [Shimwellia pseudoproteus]MBJ3813516.1 LysR family transcriptional regulator [Shimwellia pseudoproteus]
MDRIIAARVYNRICELGSLSAAARALGMSRPMVSRYLDAMESWAGARLIHRSSRRLTITPAGEEILRTTRQLASIADIIEGHATADEPVGTLRVACAHFTAVHIIGPRIPPLLERYPALRIELDISSQPVSLVGERIDLAIRITNYPEPGAIARRLGDCTSVICAAPGYLARRGVPQTPADLANHNCLCYSGFAGQSWRFTAPGGGALSVGVNGNFSTGISALLGDAALAGCGIAMIPLQEALPGLNSGALVTVLPEYSPQRLGIYGLYQSRERQPAALRLLLDDLQASLLPDRG